MAMFGIDRVMAEAADALGEQAGDSLDQIVRSALVASGTAQYVNGKSSSDTILATDYYTATEALKSIATLKTAKAVPIMNGKYPTLIHPNTEYDLYLDPIFQTVLSYVAGKEDANPWMNGYVGSAFGQTYYVTANGYSAANTSDVTVYRTLVLAKNSFGVGGLAAYMPAIVNAGPNDNNTFQTVRPLRLIDKPFGSAGTADPLDQRASVAWYTTFAVKVLDATWYIRVEHATSL